MVLYVFIPLYMYWPLPLCLHVVQIVAIILVAAVAKMLGLIEFPNPDIQQCKKVNLWLIVSLAVHVHRCVAGPLRGYHAC